MNAAIFNKRHEEQRPQDVTRYTRQLHAVICVATRNRRDMLADLLTSMSDLFTPENTTISVVVVENDDTPHSEETVDAMRPKFGGITVVYLLEPEVGIPFARNTAVRTALAMDADVVLFVDDDETIPQNWLERILANYRNTDNVLIGGPVAPKYDGPAQTYIEHQVRRGLTARFARLARKARHRARKGDLHRVTVITSNWLADRSIFDKNGIFFDESLRYTGGSDTAFFRAVRAAGLPTGWAHDAYVYETIPPERLSVGYQFRRGMEQSKTAFHAKIKSKGRLRLLPTMLVTIIWRLIAVLGMMVALPVMRGNGLVQIARSLGWVAGRVMAFLGSRSKLYVNTTGG